MQGFIWCGRGANNNSMPITAFSKNYKFICGKPGFFAAQLGTILYKDSPLPPVKKTMKTLDTKGTAIYTE